ncbi:MULTISPECIES: restriction endonuclease [Streptococcus]|uniref:nSTAND3 domain-containing NTPase n=1 Tax=Streptococcus TaxID=1301 RepID=UPI0008A5C057|nr:MULTISPECIES: restriction endonuclease [Streptococcus]MCP8923837.1 restriction endonuclease [Streptococcus oralis]OFJ65705.1 restriction endonuclease [Streptococcus sp. HMSC077F03]
MDIGIRADGMTTSDFENFAIEIVKKKFENKSLHGFKEGRDGGIDGIDNIKSPTLIIQAKRWQVNKNNTTAVKLLKEEIDKIAQTKEKYGWEADFNYVIVTSMGLSPAGLKEIRDYADKIIPNAIPTDDYIIFSSTLTTFSQQEEYRDIFINYGLLEKDISNILRSERLKWVEAESQDYFLDLDSKYLVETHFLGEAYHTLQREHIVLIQGPAGIGKTTTCSMLGNLFLNNNENTFDVIVRRVEDINEVLKLYNGNYRCNENRNLFVVFDDFLGRNKFDVGERVLQDIRKLYSASTNTNNLFICLNSRTQILQDATLMNFEFQKLIDEKFTEKRRFIIDLDKYSDIEKAYIFRKVFERKIHYLEDGDKIEFVEKYNSLIGRDWKRIIRHRNYFPRLVELIAKNFKESKENFYDYVVYYLNHPIQLYNSLFCNLEDEEKFLLFSLLQFDVYPVEEEWLINSLYTLELNPTFDFKKSLRKLDGSWLTFTKESFDDKSKVDFLNPSIIDFLNDKLKESPKITEKITQNSIYLHQLCKDCNSYGLSNLNNSQALFFTRLLDDWENFKDKDDFIGEKILAIICLNKFSKFKDNFLELLRIYDGRNNLKSYRDGWNNIITQIYYSNNKAIKKMFLTILDDKRVVNKLINSPYLDSEELDDMLDTINSIIDEVSIEDEDYQDASLRDMYCYTIFRQKKIELLQDYLDSRDTLEEEDVDFINDPNGFDIDLEVKGQVSEFKEKLTEKLTGDFQWDDIVIEKFDYSNLQYHLKEYLQWKYDDFLYEAEAYDRWRDSQLEERVTLESILNKPLL